MFTIRKLVNAAAAVAFGIAAGSWFIEGELVGGWIMLAAALIQAAAFGRLVDQE